MRLIFVRHGETNENAARRYLGHYDAELNQNGRQQLHSLTDTLKRTETQRITAIYSSDLSRTMESAQIIGEAFELRPIPVFALRELHFGEWECRTYEEIRLDEQERLEKWIQDPYTVAPPNGETLLELGNRMDEWLKENLFNQHPNETIIIVSHGGPIRWFLSKWVKGDPKEFWQVEGVGHGKAIMVECNEQTRTFNLGTE